VHTSRRKLRQTFLCTRHIFHPILPLLPAYTKLSAATSCPALALLRVFCFVFLLQGLLPRASELLKLGASVFLAFVPFILAISLAFGGIYAVFGDHFVHGGDSSYSRPTYIDPETLLSEPTVDPYIPYR
jgi:hypothetical protein